MLAIHVMNGPAEVGWKDSMDGKGRCLDNIFMEYECVYLHASDTVLRAKIRVGR